MSKIVKVFDNGWSTHSVIKQQEQQIVKHWLEKQQVTTVVINSTWYTKEFHTQVMKELQQIQFDQILLVSMLDATIPSPEWYTEFNCPVHTLGYYPGPGFVDFWALMVNKYFQIPNFDCTNADQIDTAYMCLNRKPHWHRKKLFRQLSNFNIVDQGFVSMGGQDSPAVKLLTQDQGISDLAPNAGPEQHGINNDIMSLGHSSNWTRHFLNVVTETQFDIKQTYFVSEKIYKPLLGFRPFLVYATDGAVDWLTERKFEPYVQDFVDITDLDLQQPENIALFIKTLCEQPSTYWRSKYLALKEKIMYNNNNFYNYIKGSQCQI
jgi:hypothetical protein